MKCNLAKATHTCRDDHDQLLVMSVTFIVCYFRYVTDDNDNHHHVFNCSFISNIQLKDL
jgi:hypothetical protein